MDFNCDFEHIVFHIFLTFIWACFANVCIWFLTHDTYISFLNKFSDSDALFLNYVCYILAYIFMCLGTVTVGTFTLLYIN